MARGSGTGCAITAFLARPVLFEMEWIIKFVFERKKGK